MSGWYRFRLVMLPVCFFAGAVNAAVQDHLAPADAIAPLPRLIVFGIVGVLAMPLMLAAVMFFHSVTPWSDPYWTPPTHQDNPFRLGNPLRFFHFAAFQVMATGLGIAIAAPWTRVDLLVIGVITILGGASTLVGVHLAMRLCKHKLRPTPPAPDPHT